MTADRSEFIVLLARQRSGTNALRSVLTRHPGIFCLPEVFEPSPRRYPEASYFDFLEANAPDGRVTSVMCSAEAQEQLFLEYLDFLRGFSDKQYLLFDVKYNSTHHLDGPWRSLNAQPALFDLIERHGIRVLHLTRANHLRSQVSLVQAQMSRQWWVEVEEAPASADGAVHIDPESVEHQLAAWQAEDEIVAQRFRDYPLAGGLEYDDVFPVLGGPPNPEVLAAIAGWLGLEPDFGDTQPEFRKQNLSPLREAIANYDEVAAALAGTPFEYCLEDERAYRG
jgi:hypothetical protein